MTKTKRATRTEDSTNSNQNIFRLKYTFNNVKHTKLLPCDMWELTPVCFSLSLQDTDPTYPTCSYLFRKYPALNKKSLFLSRVFWCRSSFLVVAAVRAYDEASCWAAAVSVHVEDARGIHVEIPGVWEELEWIFVPEQSEKFVWTLWHVLTRCAVYLGHHAVGPCGLQLQVSVKNGASNISQPPFKPVPEAVLWRRGSDAGFLVVYSFKP